MIEYLFDTFSVPTTIILTELQVIDYCAFCDLKIISPIPHPVFAICSIFKKILRNIQKVCAEALSTGFDHHN